MSLSIAKIECAKHNYREIGDNIQIRVGVENKYTRGIESTNAAIKAARIKYFI